MRKGKRQVRLASSLHFVLGASIILAMLAAGFSSIQATGTIIHVPADHPSIQEAIEASADEDTIIVERGVYYEHLDFQGKAITVRSVDPADPSVVEATSIDGQLAGSVVTFMSGEGQDSALRGFTIRNGRALYGGGIFCYESSPTIADCIISGNSVFAEGGGIYCSGSPASIENCTISDNLAIFGGGVWSDSSMMSMENCTISDNMAYCWGGGIGCSGSPASIENCTISGNSVSTYGGGVYCSESPASIENCTISENSSVLWGGGIYYSDSCLPGIEKCTISGNLAQWGGGVCSISSFSVYTVSSVSQDNTQEEVLTLSRYSNPDKVARRRGRGFDVPITIIVPDDGSGDFALIRNAINSLAGDTVTVQAGDCPENPVSGGNGSSLSGQDDSGPPPPVDSGQPGIVIVLGKAGSMVKTAGGVTVKGGQALTVGGDGGYPLFSPVMENCIIIANSADIGGGIYSSSSSTSMGNCTISANVADSDGGGMYCDSSSSTMRNCILWADSPNEISGNGEVMVSYSDIQGGWPGMDNINLDPEFTAPATGDFHLQATSPCIDKGINIDAPERDRDGASRPHDGDENGTVLCDMGAYEYTLDYDGDGIVDKIDPAIDEFSYDFSDGTASGTVIDPGDQILIIENEPDPLGIRIKAAPSGGASPALISTCGGSTISLDAGEEVVVTCGSVEVTVIRGTVDVTFTTATGTFAAASMSAGSSMVFDQGDLTFTAPDTNSEPVIITVQGREFSIDPGETRIFSPAGDPYPVPLSSHPLSIILLALGIISIIGTQKKRSCLAACRRGD